MKKLSLILIALFLVPTLFLTSCDRGDDPSTGAVAKVPTFTLLQEYMVDSSLDINKVISNDAGIKFVVGAPDPTTHDAAAYKAKYYIMDIRSAANYATSHIEGAVNVAFGDILTAAANKGSKQILVVCYTGQTACYATALLRMYGHPNAQALKWGMTGWSGNEGMDKWTGNVGNVGSDNVTNWKFDTTPAVALYNEPVIVSLSEDGSDILKERVEQVVQDGFKTASNVAVVAAPSDYFINNYFSETDYTGFGHIIGAQRISPLTIAGGEYMNLDADAKIVTYCYTGQTSAVVTACLNVLGYDAYSLTFGMNGLNHDSSQWSSNQWGVGSSKTKNLPVTVN